MPEIFARVQRQGPIVSLGPRVFRKEMLRTGVWQHPDAPGGRLEITAEMFQKIIDNFKARVRDDVPVPKGHDLDALENSGHVVGLEAVDDRLFGMIEFKDEKIAEDVAAGKITGGSAMINLNHVDKEKGTENGPTLIHWALTNAPYIKGLAPYEAVALGEDANGATIIALTDEKGGSSVDPIQEALKLLKDASDEDIRKALEADRPDVLKVEKDGTEPDLEAVKTEAKEEATKELVAALAEKGVVVEFSEKGGKDDEKKIDVTKSPEYVALSEEIEKIKTESAKKEAEALIDQAIKEVKVLPAQKEALMEVALSEGGMDRVKKLIPEKSLVDLSEIGVAPTKETSVELSEDDAEKEADRYLALVGGKKEDSD